MILQWVIKYIERTIKEKKFIFIYHLLVMKIMKAFIVLI